MRAAAIGVLSVAALLCGASAVRAAEPPPAVPAAQVDWAGALRAFLRERGDVCLARYDWPIDVSARDVAAGTRDAVQLPVLERIGLVASAPGVVVYRTGETEEKVPTWRYTLTELGRRSYKARPASASAGAGPAGGRRADLCAGHLDLDRVVGVRLLPAAAAGEHGIASVSYRYRFTPEPWAGDAAVRRVFPMLDQLIEGQGRQQMTQNFRFDGHAWVADAAVD